MCVFTVPSGRRRCRASSECDRPWKNASAIDWRWSPSSSPRHSPIACRSAARSASRAGAAERSTSVEASASSTSSTSREPRRSTSRLRFLTMAAIHVSGALFAGE